MFALLLADTQSLAVRSAIAATLGTLFQLSPQWVDEHGRELFTDDGAQSEAALVGFMAEWHSSRWFLERFRYAYDQAIGRLADHAFDDSFGAEALGIHLVELYWRATIELDDPLIVGFFSTASGKRRGRALWFVTHSVEVAGDALDAEVRRRIDDLWAWRIKVGVDAEDRQDELSWFAYYATVRGGDLHWRLEMLRAILQSGVAINHMMLVERLADASDALPVLTFDCYELLVKQDLRQRYLVHEESGRKILCNALATRDREAAVRDLVNSLAAEGILQFRDVLTEDGCHDK